MLVYIALLLHLLTGAPSAAHQPIQSNYPAHSNASTTRAANA